MGQSKWSYIDTDTSPVSYVNTNSANLAAAVTPEARATLEGLLSDDDAGVVARVIHVSGNYVKVKWFKNGKVIGMYKARGHTLAKATSALEYYKENALGLTGVDTIETTIADDTLAIAATSQLTVTATLDDEETEDVTDRSVFSTADATKATVSTSGLVTAVDGDVKASGTLTSDATAPSDADTVTIGNKVYTFKTTLTPNAKAVVTLTSDATNPTEDDTVTLGETVYRFRDTLAQAYDVKIGASAAVTLDNLKAAVNATGTAGVEYYPGTLVHPSVSATTNTDTTQVFEALATGTAGNSIASTEESTHLSFGAATLTGGTATVANQVLIGASAAASLDNLKSAINATAGSGTTYSTGTTVHTQVTATTNTDTTQVVQAIKGGTSPNAYATTETSSHLSWGAETLEGGTAAVVAITADYAGNTDAVDVTID